MDNAAAPVRRRFEKQYGVITRNQALEAGMTSAQITRSVSAGRWVRCHLGVYRLAGSPVTPAGELLTACLAVPRSVASHESAAWLWRLLPRPPSRPVVTIDRSARHRQIPSPIVHRTRDLCVERTVVWRGIPCTDPCAPWSIWPPPSPSGIWTMRWIAGSPRGSSR